MKRLLIILLLTVALHASAQHFTGTWVGETLYGDYMRMELIQVGDSLYGMVYDEGGGGYCISNFVGVYSRRGHHITGRTVSFIDHTPNHVLSAFDIRRRKKIGGEYLKGLFRSQLTAGDPVRWPTTAFELRKQSDRVDTTAFMKAHAEQPPAMPAGSGAAEKIPARHEIRAAYDLNANARIIIQYKE